MVGERGEGEWKWWVRREGAVAQIPMILNVLTEIN